MNINKTNNNGEIVLALTGRLDTTTAPQLDAELQTVYPDASLKSLVFDFSGLEYLSSAGLRVLISAQKKMKTIGEMVIRNVNETVQEVFEITGLTDVLTIE